LNDIYTSGEYGRRHQTWHAEDSAWKAGHIHRIVRKNNVRGRKVAEIGCGAGGILSALSAQLDEDMVYFGYDISPQAIEMARIHERIAFQTGDLLSAANREYFDILLVIDVLEHVPDYMAFLQKCRAKARYKIYHIPLDLSVWSVIGDSFIKGRRTLGHLHYFSLPSAIACLEDTGHIVMDYFLADVGTYYSMQSPTFKGSLANLPRRILARFNRPLAAKIFGRYSVMILAT
jgi:SAM-dependent methyltransferase